MKIKNTFGFTPKFRKEANVEISSSEVQDQVLVLDGAIAKGEATIAHIRANADKTFLVAKATFDHLKELGYRNVCMFDPLTKEGDRDTTTYGGLLFP